jgi:hypothetical protein
MGFEHVPGSDKCEKPEDDEPSLGSFDLMMDQSRSWDHVNSWDVDYEQDDCDKEDDDPAEESEASYRAWEIVAIGLMKPDIAGRWCRRQVLTMTRLGRAKPRAISQHPRAQARQQRSCE